MILADAPRPSLDAAPAAPPAPAFAPAVSGEARLLRRLRRLVRRRVRIDVAALGGGAADASDGGQTIRVETLSPRDPHFVAWSSDRPLALVVLHDGCGARVVGQGGVAGRIELPSELCPQAFLAFCYDAEAGSRPREGGNQPALSAPEAPSR